MVGVGMELTLADFRRVLHFPAAVFSAIALQAVLLPIIAWMIAQLLQADAQLAASLILIAAAPIATSANYYVLLARGDTALSVTLTALSNLAALAATPLVVAASFEWLWHDDARVRLPVALAMRQLLLGLLLPIGVGMMLRRFAQDWTQRYRKYLQGGSAALLVAIIGVVLANQADTLAPGLGRLAAATLLFTLASAGVGYALAAKFRCDSGARISLAIAFCDRNLSIAMMLAVAVLDRLDFVGLSAAFFVMQALLLLPALLLARRRRASFR